MEYSQDLLDQTLELRRYALDNRWHREMLEQHHPREDYDADPVNVPAPLRFAHAMLSESGNLSDLINMVGMPLQALLGDLYSWTCMDTSMDGADATQDFQRMLRVLSALSEPLSSILAAKSEHAVERPKSYSPDLGDTFSYPAMRAGIFCEMVKAINANFTLSWEQLRQLQDAAYLLGMFCVMGGLNTLQDVLDAQKNTSMWNLTPQRALH